METRCCKVFFLLYFEKKSAEDPLVLPQKLLDLLSLFHVAAGVGICAFTLSLVNTLIKQLTRR